MSPERLRCRYWGLTVDGARRSPPTRLSLRPSHTLTQRLKVKPLTASVDCNYCYNHHMTGMANTAPRPCLFTHSQSHSHSLTITCTCCCDGIYGAQGLKISHAHSLILSISDTESGGAQVLDSADEALVRTAADKVCRMRYQGNTHEQQLELSRLACGMLPAEVSSYICGF